jgi:hypothetical protein
MRSEKGGTIVPTIEDWKDAVARSYRSSVSAEEYNAKATSEAIQKIAYYLMNTSGNDAGTMELLDDTSDEEPNSQVQMLMDFLAFTAEME